MMTEQEVAEQIGTLLPAGPLRDASVMVVSLGQRLLVMANETEPGSKEHLLLTSLAGILNLASMIATPGVPVVHLQEALGNLDACVTLGVTAMAALSGIGPQPVEAR